MNPDPLSPDHGRSSSRGMGILRRRRRNSGRWWIWLLVLAMTACFHDVGTFSRGLWAADGSAESAASAEHAAQPGTDADSAQSEQGEPANSKPAHGHSDPVAPVLIAIVLMLLAAKLGGDLVERINLPAVLGELTVGILIGNFALLTGSTVLDQYFKLPPISASAAADHEGTQETPAMATAVTAKQAVGSHPESVYNTAAVLKILASIGVILLLFEVGLESTVREMMTVGVSSFLVAVLGVIAPIVLGWWVSSLIITDEGWQDHAFIGATLCATSVGITARVLKDLGRMQDVESRIILGAAVIDDVLGLIVLAVISGVISEGAVSVWGLSKIVTFAFGFLAGALILGAFQLPRMMFRAASALRGHGLLVVTALLICFGFSYMANLMGLAPIVGAFAAGLILEGTNYQETERWKHQRLEDALAPISALLVPIFFVEMGISVDLKSFTNPSVWGLAAAITAVAIIGKQVCAFGVREKGLNRLAVGLGMIPRGEVGLIFAAEGRKLVANGEPVISSGTYSAVIVMVMLTTMVTPPLLKWSMSRNGPSGETGESDK